MTEQETEVINFMSEDEVPKKKGIFGGTIIPPEFVFSVCSRCDTHGYTSETALMVADEEGIEVICQECSQE